MKTNNYYVIGGQYNYICYGGAPTLIGAKRLSNRNREYLDNWQGWHAPAIYNADDTEIVTVDGREIRVPKRDAYPVGTQL